MKRWIFLNASVISKAIKTKWVSKGFAYRV